MDDERVGEELRELDPLTCPQEERNCGMGAIVKHLLLDLAGHPAVERGQRTVLLVGLVFLVERLGLKV